MRARGVAAPQHPSQRSLHTPMGRTVEAHGWRLAVDPPQTGPPSGPSADGLRPSADDVQRCASPLNTRMPPALTRAMCTHSLPRVRASRSCADQRWRPPADASTSTTTAGASPRRSATWRPLLPMRPIAHRRHRQHMHGHGRGSSKRYVCTVYVRHHICLYMSTIP